MLNVRVFLSHSAQDKIIVGPLKEKLQSYGIDVFLAHDDLEGGTEWMSKLYEEINECEIFLILLSEKYHLANFTDQELGIALSYNLRSKKPHIIPICIDTTTPYGFMSKFQCVKYDLKLHDVSEIVNIIMRYSNPGQEHIDLLISCLESAGSFTNAHKHAEELSSYNKLTKEQANKVWNAYQNNDQIYNSSWVASVVKRILRNNKKQLSKKVREELKL